MRRRHSRSSRNHHGSFVGRKPSGTHSLRGNRKHSCARKMFRSRMVLSNGSAAGSSQSVFFGSLRMRLSSVCDSCPAHAASWPAVLILSDSAIRKVNACIGPSRNRARANSASAFSDRAPFLEASLSSVHRDSRHRRSAVHAGELRSP